jgi:hypothetical protein
MSSVIKIQRFMLLDNRKRQNMDQATETSVEYDNNNLILGVPSEVVKCYAQYLDLKSLVMFHCASKTSCDRQYLRYSEERAIQRMLDGIVGVCKDILNIVSSREGQNRMLANILRKLIYVSVSDVTPHTNNSIATTQTLTEYNAILDHITNEMDISMYTFNELLEDAQFEFRGFNIINITKERRDDLDKVKSMIQEWYFSKPFTVHTYSTFGTTCVELDCNKEVAMFDVHRHMNEEAEAQDMMFLMDAITHLTNGEDGVLPDDVKLIEEMNKHVKLVQYMYHWDMDNKQSTNVMSRMIMRLMDCHPFFEGSTEICLEVWNDILDDNWVLASVIDELLTNGMYGFILKDVTDDCKREFRHYSTLQNFQNFM